MYGRDSSSGTPIIGKRMLVQYGNTLRNHHEILIHDVLRELLARVSTDYNLDHKELIEKYISGTQSNISSGPAASGKAYEQLVHSVISRCIYQGERFCTQTIAELGGSGAGHDHQCIRGVNIESKRYPNPDWTQITLVHNGNCWICSKGRKLQPAVTEEFNRLLGKIHLWNGKIPTFINEPITHETWCKEKKDFQDVYVACDSVQIATFYRKKGCAYIQVSGGKGLYHTGEDPLKLDVPLFECPQQIRVRVKVHSRKDKKGYAKLSVTASCQPVRDISIISPYSLDDINRLPPSFVYDHNL